MNALSESTTDVGRLTDLFSAPKTDPFLDRLRSGDESACEQLVREHAPRMLAVARRFFRCDHDAADALQDAFLSAFNAIGSFTGQSSLSTWLHRITVNACLMRLRSSSRHETASLDDLLPTFDDTGHRTRSSNRQEDCTLDHVMAEEIRTQVRMCIDQLPESYRTVLLLRDIEGMDTAQTAKALFCSEANVKTRLHRARQALKSLIERTSLMPR